MKKILSLLVLLPLMVFAQTQTQNYIKTKTYKVATTASILSPTITQAYQNITYFDGLGRPIQQIAHQQSGSGKDIVTPIEYDGFGRQEKEYLPYVPNASASLEYKASALTDVFNFTPYTGQNPFSQKQLEASPLNRVFKQAAPGNDWALNSGHEIKLDYQTNTTADAVKLFTVTANWDLYKGLYNIPTSLTPASYSNFQLYKTITYDENTPLPSGEVGGGTQEFKNKEGQVVLKRTYESGVTHDTYYAYDQYGNLTFVIPPLVDANSTITQTILDGLCYQYKYDYRNRLVEKKLPGKQWEFIVYDKLDRVVATGPALSPFSDLTTVGWLITKYDAFSRVAYTGWENSTATASTRTSKQYEQKVLTTSLNEAKSAPGVIDGIATFYTNTVAPTAFKLLTVNYYDDYNFNNTPSFPAYSYNGVSSFYNNTTMKPRGMSTGSWVRVVTTTSSTVGETNYVLYDYKARPIRNYTVNHLGGYTRTDIDLDFSGKTTHTYTTHKRINTDIQIAINEYFTYSPQDRLLTHTHQVNSLPVQLLTSNTYDELGQLISKNVGNTSAAPLQKVDYAYNIRGWLKGINNDPTNNLVLNTNEKDLFAFKINYNSTEGNVASVKSLYNGNISETYYRTGSDNVLRKYGYQYDNLNRLKNAIYQKPGGNTYPTYEDFSEKNITYDKNGNIQTLSRNGDVIDALPANQIDNLYYTYKANSNVLTSVYDNSGNSSGFKDTNTGADDYSYDANGNMTVDKNKNIISIKYNHLNLPTSISLSNGNISYIYNALGQKVEKTVIGYITSDFDKTYYTSGFQYKDRINNFPNSKLQFIATSEGYYDFINTKYVFNYTDHLGNIRLSYAKNPTTNVLEIIEESNYYPFGLKHKNYNSNNYQPAYKYKYNGKELQDELGLNVYDYGWRNYMPDIGRWTQIDPLFNDLKFANDINDVDPDDHEEVYMAIINDLEIGGGIYNTDNLNPYGYGYNNPVSFDDPDGRCPSCIWGAIIGAGIEYGSQVVTNYAQGKTGSDAWTNVDGGKILISAGTGALTGGISSIKAIGATAKVYKVVAASATVGMGEIVQQGYENGTNKPVNVKKLAIEIVADKLPIPKIKSVKLDSSIKVAEKVANRAERVGAKRASREAAIKTAKQEVNKLKNQKAANNVANEAVNSTTKQVIKEPIKNRTN